MRYYIEAYRADGTEILGNLDGQRALGDLSSPLRTRAWKTLGHPVAPRPKWGRVHHWRLMSADGVEIARQNNPYWSNV